MFEKRTLNKTGKQLLETRKRSAFVQIGGSQHHAEPSYWQEGSRTLTYTMTKRNGSVFVQPVITSCSPFESVPDKVVDLNDETIVFTTGTFCGKDATPFIHCKDEATLKQFGLFKE